MCVISTGVTCIASAKTFGHEETARMADLATREQQREINAFFFLRVALITACDRYFFLEPTLQLEWNNTPFAYLSAF